MCTISDTNVTTAIISAGQMIDQKSDLDLEAVAEQPRVHRAVESLPCRRNRISYITYSDSAQDSATPAMATLCAPARPMARPNTPAAIAATSGASAIVR